MSEYTATSVNAKGCAYSNIPKYGANGNTSKLKAPMIVSRVPDMFSIIQPHNSPNSEIPNKQQDLTCSGYSRLDRMNCRYNQMSQLSNMNCK